MIKKLLITALLFTAPLLAEVNKASLGMNITTADLEIEGKFPIGGKIRRVAFRNFFVDGNFINTDNNALSAIGVHVENSPHGHSNILLGFGIRGLYSKNDALDKTFVAFPISMLVQARMYFGNLPKSALSMKVSYAPSPLTFSDAKTYLEYRIEADMQIIDNIDLYLGFRNIDTNYDSQDLKFNSKAYAGARFVF